MVINNRPVSDNILRIISERGYKQSAVARKAGYSRQTFGYMVHNTRIIRPEDVQRIALVGTSIRSPSESTPEVMRIKLTWMRYGKGWTRYGSYKDASYQVNAESSH